MSNISRRRDNIRQLTSLITDYIADYDTGSICRYLHMGYHYAAHQSRGESPGTVDEYRKRIRKLLWTGAQLMRVNNKMQSS